MTVYSNVEPTKYFVDKIENGVATVLVHTNIVHNGTTWEYNEEIVKLPIPGVGVTKDDVTTMLNSSSLLTYPELLEKLNNKCSELADVSDALLELALSM